MPITRSILAAAAQHPDRLAIVGDDLRMTYGELVNDGARVQAAVEHLLAATATGTPTRTPMTAPPEAQGRPVIGICITDAAENGRLITGLAGFGAISATIDPRWPLAHQLHVVIRTGMAIVITDSASLHAALSGTAQAPVRTDAASAPTELDAADAALAPPYRGTVIDPQTFDELTRTLPPAAPPSVRDGEEPFLLLFSSGTTSAPKGFIRTRREYRYNIAVSSRHLSALPGERTLAPGPISYSLTLYALLEVLATGGTCFLSDSFSPIPLISRIVDERIERIVAVPAAVQGIAQAARHAAQTATISATASTETVKLIVTGGANLSSAVRENVEQTFPGTPLISYYGAAEIGFIGDSRGGDGTRIRIYDGVEVSIRDENGRPVPAGQVGELHIRVASTAAGYVGALTDEHLVDEHGWATVHDQGRLVRGDLELVGRAGDIVVTGGHKVSLPEVERALAALPGCERSCAVALPDRSLGSIVVAVIEDGERPEGRERRLPQASPPRTVAMPTKTKMLAELRERLAPQFVPRRFYRVQRLPRTVGGKIRRTETAQLLTSGDPGVERM